jgi:ribosome recycling factor
VRACRRDAMDAVKKMQTAAELTEDELRDAEAEIQKLTDKYVAAVEKHVEAKEAELMKI